MSRIVNRDDPRYHRLLEAAREAALDGYDAVSMRDIAKRTRMSLTSVYQFCTSKDQLIAEAHAQSMDDMRVQFAKRPRGETALARVTAVLRRIARALEVDEVRTRTMMRALYSGAPGVDEARLDLGATHLQTIDAAIGEEEVPDREAVIATIGHVIDSTMMNWLAGRYTAAEVSCTLERTAQLLLGPRAR